MISNMELYGTNDVPKVPKEICDEFIGLLKERLEVLIAVHFMEQDNDLIKKVQKGITFWTVLKDGVENEW